MLILIRTFSCICPKATKAEAKSYIAYGYRLYYGRKNSRKPYKKLATVTATTSRVGTEPATKGNAFIDRE
jgi:hypothetical protein